MATKKPIGVKIKDFLYPMGVKAFANTLLDDIPKSDPRWFEIANDNWDSTDLGVRTKILNACTAKGFVDKPSVRNQVIQLILRFLKDGTVEHRRQAIDFIASKPEIFNPENDLVVAQLNVSLRDRDAHVANTAEKLLKKFNA